MKIRLYNLQELLMLTENPIKELMPEDISKFKKYFRKQLKNSFFLESISLSKTYKFNLEKFGNFDEFKIIGGNIRIKEIIGDELYFKNISLLKKLVNFFRSNLIIRWEKFTNI